MEQNSKQGPQVLSEQHLFDYMLCPAYFSMKYVKKIPVEDQVSMPRLLTKVSKYFYTTLFNRKTPSMEMLKKKWDLVCNEFPEYATAKRSIEGIAMLTKLYQWFSGERINVLDFDSRYSLDFEGCEIIGNTGLIVGGRDKLELLITDFSTRLPEQLVIDLKLKYTLDAYAFYSLYGKQLSGIRVHSVKYDQDFYTFRVANDFKRLATAAISVSKGIKNGIYYPREITCSTCTAVDYCKGWN